jgi:hypothetical protein
MDTWAAIILAGGVGGIFNAILADGGLKSWRKDVVDGTTIWRLGWIGNVLIGAAGGWLNWVLNGSTIGAAAWAAALLVGISGTRFITSQLDKQLGETSSRLQQESFKEAIRQLREQVQQLPPGGPPHPGAHKPQAEEK